MAFDIVHNVDKAIHQLLTAPDDLAGLIPDQGKAVAIAESTAEHQEVYAEYLANFRVAYDVADNWWKGCVQPFIDDGHSREEAIDMAYDNRLAGPASAPEVVWFFRTYWLEFDEVNRGLAAKDRVPPQVCMLGWLVEEGHQDYIRLLTCMPYWPMGLDENGNWT
jgi:hypothetical protein